MRRAHACPRIVAAMGTTEPDGEARTTPAKVNAFLRDSFPGSDSECVALGPRWAVARVTPDPAKLRPGGYVSGPTQFALADSLLWFALFGAVGIEPMAMTSELSVRFLRPAVGSVLWGRAELDIVGRRSVVGTVRLWVDDAPDRIVSIAQGTYVRPTPERADPLRQPGRP
jgi:acyl-coenzyme A thioesterase PaaI-like protein